MKEENKQYKADNKIIMKQIDRISKSMITPEEKMRVMQEKEMRVIKSLYIDTICTIDEKRIQDNHER